MNSSAPPAPVASADPPPSLFAELRSLPRAYWALFIGIFINRFGSFVYPFLTIMLTRRHFADWEIGIALGGYGVGGLAATLGGGWFADRFGRKNTIILGTLANAICVTAMAHAHSLGWVLTLTSLTGFTVGFFGPAAGALVADIVPKSLQLRAYAGTRMAANAGFACGTAMGGLLVNKAPMWLFYGDAITTASYGLLAFWLLPHGVKTNSPQEASWSQAWKVLRADRRFLALFFSQIFASLIFAQFSTTYSKEINHREGLLSFGGKPLAPEEVFGFLVGWNGLMIVFCELALTRWTQRFPDRYVLTLGHILLAIGIAGNAIATSFLDFFAFMTLFTIGEMMSLPLISAAVANLAPEQMRGRYMGGLSMAWATANLLGPQLGFSLYGWNSAALWGICGLFGLIAAAIQWRSLGPRQQVS
jgi:MFS family permease